MRLRDLRIPVLVMLAVALTLLPAQATVRPARTNSSPRSGR